jgi:hypothetical protein
MDDGHEMSVWVYWYRGPVHERRFIVSGSFEDNCQPA